MLPCIASMICLLSAKPKPVPSVLDCSAPNRSKAVNNRSFNSSGMPAPSSNTSMMILESLMYAETKTVELNGPYLSALDNRFNMTCNSFCRSDKAIKSGCIR